MAQTTTLVPEAPAAPAGPARPTDTRLSPTYAAVIGLGWFVGMWVMAALEPVPADAASHGALFQALSIVVTGLLLGTVGAAALRLRAAAVLGTVLGVITLGGVVECPVSGHHVQLGLWWAAQLAIAGALLAVSAAGLRRRKV